MLDLSIVVVNWNVRELLKQCLRSVLAAKRPSGLATEVIVIDNASSDGSVEMVRDEFPQVRLIANNENLGFTGGNNQGIVESQGRDVLLLNPDTEVLGDALAKMVYYMDAHPDVGALGPMLLNPDGSVQSSRRGFPTLATALLESTVFQWELSKDNQILRRYYVLNRPDNEVQEVDWVTGACILMRREAIEEVGLLDEGFFMYSEELDWCSRAKERGWKVIYLPTAKVVHYGGKSSEQVVPFRHIQFQRSKIRYFRKHHGRLSAWILRLFLLAMYAYLLLVESLKWLVGHKRPLRARRVRAYWRVLQSGLG